jgi:hypothetical protein
MPKPLVTVEQTMLVAFILVAGLAAVVVSQAQQRNAKPAALTALDYAEIQQLYAHYAFAYDTAADNGNTYAQLFTEDGAFIFPPGDPRCKPDCRVAGRARLAEIARGNGNKGPLTLSHFTTNVTIDPTPDGVKGRAYLAVIAVGKGGERVLNQTGVYDDELVKTSEGWRYRTRAYIKLPEPQPAGSRTTP